MNILQIGPADALGVNLSHEDFARGGRSYDLAVGSFEGMDPAEVAWYVVTLQEYVMPPGGLFLVVNPRPTYSEYPFDRKWKVLHAERREGGGLMLLRRTELGSRELRLAIEDLCR